MPDLIIGLAYAFAVIIMLAIFTFAMQSALFPAIKASPAVQNNSVATGIVNKGSNFFTGLNNVAVFIFIFVALGAIGAAAFTESHPFFAIVSIAILPIELVLSLGFHDAFFALIQSNTIFGTYATTYPIVLYSFQYLPLITLVVSILVMFATYAK